MIPIKSLVNAAPLGRSIRMPSPYGAGFIEAAPTVPIPAIIGARLNMQATNFERITVDPNQMGGVPCIRGLRIPVATVLRMLAGGMTEHEILGDYPDLQNEDIRECLRFAAVSAMERDLPLSRTA